MYKEKAQSTLLPAQLLLQSYDQLDQQQGDAKRIYTNFGQSDYDKVEMHVVGGKTIIDTEYSIESWFVNHHDNVIPPHIKLDLHQDIRDLGYINGEFTLRYNFYSSFKRRNCYNSSIP